MRTRAHSEKAENAADGMQAKKAPKCGEEQLGAVRHIV
jgi:hypothetical protein